MNKEALSEVYESLKGTRVVDGQLKIEGYTHEMYEDLYSILIEDYLASYILASGDFTNWYRRVCTQYIRYRQATNRRYDFYTPQMEAIENHSVREQLAVFKFFIYRRGGTGSAY